MTIDFGAESRRHQSASGSLRARYPQGTLPPLAPPSPLAAYGRAASPALAPRRSILDADVAPTPGELAKLIRQRSAQGEALDAPFHSFFSAWPLLGRRSALAVIRHHYMVQLGHEPTLDECDRYLRAATSERLNSGELRFRIAVDSGAASPGGTLSRGQALERRLASFVRGLGLSTVPFGFRPAALAFDGFVLDAMRLVSAFVQNPERNEAPERA